LSQEARPARIARLWTLPWQQAFRMPAIVQKAGLPRMGRSAIVTGSKKPRLPTIRCARKKTSFWPRPRSYSPSKDTIAFAVAHERPCLHLSAMDDQPEKKLVTFIRKNKVRILNVAGSRESKEPGIYSFTLNVLSQLFHPVALLKTKF